MYPGAPDHPVLHAQLSALPASWYARLTCQAHTAGHGGQVDLLRCEVADLGRQPRLRADTVVMNPPFGTRQRGADLDFLRAAFQVRAANLGYGALQGVMLWVFLHPMRAMI